MVVEFAAEPRGTPPGRPPGELRVGDDVDFRFRIADSSTGGPLEGGRPAAWVAPRSDVESRGLPDIARKVALLARGDRLASPELDLNQDYILALNDDSTITVVDPRFGFGGTKLLALVTLPGVGEDWALSIDGTRLFVSVPSADRIVAVETAGWTIEGAIEGIPRPTRLAIQGDGHYLWVAYGHDDGSAGSGAAVVDAEGLKLAARIPTGRGPHALAIGRDDGVAFVSNRGAGTVSIIDVRRLGKIADVPTGRAPGPIAYSSASGSAYVVDEVEGTVSAVSSSPPSVTARIEVGRGSGPIAFAPGGRLAFVANPEEDEVTILDAASHRVLRRVEAEGGPDQVAFTDRVAYIRQARSPMVRLIPLDGASAAGRPTTVFDVSGGRGPLGPTNAPVSAPSIARASTEGAVLIANPADQAIYYYKEGLSAPSGSFRNYGHEPRAVLAVDRSLRPDGPGVYRTSARLRKAGQFDMAFFLDNPRLALCFDLVVADDPDRPTSPQEPELDVRLVADDVDRFSGRAHPLRFRVVEKATDRPVGGRADVRVLATLPGRWQRSFDAVEGAEPGGYSIDFAPPRAGLYLFYVQVPSAGLAARTPIILRLEVKETL